MREVAVIMCDDPAVNDVKRYMAGSVSQTLSSAMVDAGWGFQMNGCGFSMSAVILSEDGAVAKRELVRGKGGDEKSVIRRCDARETGPDGNASRWEWCHTGPCLSHAGWWSYDP
jgi:hypothetical protein